ncbi:MAG: YihY/virulence factor BrkB family protein [Nocardioides sp.]|nr:YihY/virulence factor BrkB family protein [Nocardioides sp.]
MDKGFVAAINRWMERHPRLSVPLAVVYKFFDDQGNYLAAGLTYYAFVAIFPLMLLGSSILGVVLEGRPELQQSLLDSALNQFPIIGEKLGRPETLRGSPGSVIAGSLAALYGALGLGQAIQNAQNQAWSVPRNSRPNPFLMRLRSLGLLVVVGLALLAISILSEIANSTDLFGWAPGGWVGWGLRLGNVIIVAGVLTLLFRMAAARGHRLVRAAPGGLAVALMWQVLQYAGGAYVGGILKSTSSMTQTFGLVLGLVAMIYVGAVMAILGVELNVVLAAKLYPRTLLAPFVDGVRLTLADRKVYEGLATSQRLKGFEHISVDFDMSPLEVRTAQEQAEAQAEAAANQSDPSIDSTGS